MKLFISLACLGIFIAGGAIFYYLVIYTPKAKELSRLQRLEEEETQEFNKNWAKCTDEVNKSSLTDSENMSELIRLNCGLGRGCDLESVLRVFDSRTADFYRFKQTPQGRQCLIEICVGKYYPGQYLAKSCTQ